MNLNSIAADYNLLAAGASTLYQQPLPHKPTGVLELSTQPSATEVRVHFYNMCDTQYMRRLYVYMYIILVIYLHNLKYWDTY